MKAYHGDPKLKAMLIEEIEKHRKSDQLAKGYYGRENGKFTGCAIGCSIHSLNVRLGKLLDYDDHAGLAREVAIPEVLLRIEDFLFERLEQKESQTWPGRFAKSIQPGTDLSHVHGKFFAWTLIDEQVGFWKMWKSPEDQQVFKDFGNFIAYLATDQPFNKEQWEAVRHPFTKCLASHARLASLDRLARLASHARLASLASHARLASLDRLARLASLDSLASLASLASHARLASLASLASHASLDRLDSLASLASHARLASLDSLASLDRLDSLASLDVYKIASEKVLELLAEAPLEKPT